VPVQLLDGDNVIVHVGDHESDPRRRPLTRGELQALFDLCDQRVAGRRALRRKGSLAALRDGALFKVCYAWGLRRTELVGLDVCDLLPNPHSRGSAGAASSACATGGVARKRAKAARRADGVGMGGGRAGAVRGRDPSAVRVR
jgi:hypothetical protein